MIGSLLLCAGVFAAAQSPDPAPGVHQKPDAEGVYYVGPDITPPAISRAVNAESKDFPKGFTGGFSVWSVIIQTDGTPTDVHAVQSAGGEFDTAAAKAIYACTFAPGKLNGTPVPVHIGVAVPFFLGIRPHPRIAVLEQDLDVAKDAAVRSANAPPLLIHSAEPLFTTDAIRAKYHGVVLISALIGKDGVPTEVRETKPLGMGLDQLAIDAVQRYRYLPALKDGVPVAERVNITVNLKVY